MYSRAFTRGYLDAKVKERHRCVLADYLTASRLFWPSYEETAWSTYTVILTWAIIVQNLWVKFVILQKIQSNSVTTNCLKLTKRVRYNLGNYCSKCLFEIKVFLRCNRVSLFIICLQLQVRAAARGAANRLRIYKPKSRMGYLRQRSDGITRF